jgi:hypothetical protein
MSCRSDSGVRAVFLDCGQVLQLMGETAGIRDQSPFDTS